MEIKLGAEGYPAPGRFQMSLEDLHTNFVADHSGTTDSPRQRLWQGLMAYLSSWSELENNVGHELIIGIWLGGSFISNKPNPSDIDISPILLQGTFDALKGKPGSKMALRLSGRNRDSIKLQYGLEVFPLWVNSLSSTLDFKKFDLSTTENLASRGGLDVWWQRIKPPISATPLSEDYCPARGYIEVML